VHHLVLSGESALVAAIEHRRGVHPLADSAVRRKEETIKPP
jgi:hypothetical protein